MKKDWTYKKLGEVLLVERGGSPRPIQEYITTADDGLNWIKIGDAVEGSKYITSTKEKIKPEGLKKTRFVHKGDFILSNSMSFGRPYILGIDGCIHDGWLVLRDNDDTFDKSYLYYYLSNPYLYEEFKRLAVGGVVNNLNSDIVRNVQVAIPPLSIQRSIVAELDLLHSVISKKKEQLRELDNLAQSLFYQMFGDPITNPMGWEIKKLGEVVAEDCSLSYGIVQPGNHVENGIPVVRPIDLIDTYVYRKGLKCTSAEIASAYKRTVLKGNELLMCVRGTTGVISIASLELVGCNTTRGITPIALDEKVSKWFVYHLIKMSSYQQLIASLTYGIALKQINMKDVRTLPIILPPLPLQQSFAAKVSAIEAQKQAITQSIKDVESLLAQRMDNYFG